MDKHTLIDIIICIVLTVVIGAEVMVGFRMLQNKWASDTTKIIDQSASYGKMQLQVDTAFSWPEATQPDVNGDVVAIDANRFRVNGLTTNKSTDQTGYAYYSSVDDSNASHYIQYKEVLDKSTVDGFHNALTSYFDGDSEGLVSLLEVNTVPENIQEYQQTFTDGAIPILFDSGSGLYFMFLDCVNSYYLLQCDEPFCVSDDKVSLHYGNAADDPMTTHAWSMYEAGAIDNTRKALMDNDQALDSYTQTGTVESGTSAVSNGGVTVDIAGNSYTNQSEVSDSSALYVTPEDDAARELLVSYGSKKFGADGTAEDGSGSIDISSTSAKASEWVLTETQYSYTDYGITLNGLSGRRTSSLFEVNGSASNTVSAARPWVLVIKFMGADNTLLGVKVIDNRANPIPADGVSQFSVQLGASDEIQFSDIVAIQFAVH